MRSVPGFVIPLKKIMGWIRRRRVRSSKKATKSQQAVILPDDIILLVLAKLPIKFLLRFKCVSKSWNSIVSDPHFLQLNQRRSANPSLLYYRDYLDNQAIYRLTFNIKNSCFYDVQLHPPWKKQQKSVRCDYQTCEYYEILGSCNGLLLVIGMSRYGPAAGDLILWNPLTSQFRILPKYPCRGRSPYKVECKGRASYGFGYDVSTDDYKVVRAVEYYECSKIYVFSVKSNTWSSGKVHCTPIRTLASVEYSHLNLSSMPVPYQKYAYEYEKGIILDGILHWLPPHYGRLTSFDLSTEEFGKILLPECNPIFGVWIYLGTLSGRLCFWYYYNKCIDLGGRLRNTDGLMVDVWVMKEYGVTSSWTKLLVLSPGIPRGCYPMGDVFVPFLFSSKEDELMYLIKRNKQDEDRDEDLDKYQDRMAVKYNLRNLTFDNVRDLPPRRIHRYSFPYMESLASIGKSFSMSRPC